MYKKKIDNVKELLLRMDDKALSYLQNELISAGIPSEKAQSNYFKQILVEEHMKNIESEFYSIIEEFVYRNSHIAEIKFNPEFKSDIFYRNSDLFEMFIFLFDKFEYQYSIDYIDESIDLDLFFYWDLCLRTGISEKPFCSERINYFWYYENKSLVDRCYQIACRSEKVEIIIQKSDAKKYSSGC